MSRINGHKVCGKRGGLPFVDAVHTKVDKNGQLVCAKEGWTPCDKNGNVEFTMCFPPGGSIKEDCPITSVEFVKGNIADLKFDKKGTKLPLISVKLSSGPPCKDSMKQPASLA